jgi:hypothetical protein
MEESATSSSLILKMEVGSSSERLVTNYNTTQCHNLEDHSLNIHRHDNINL